MSGEEGISRNEFNNAFESMRREFKAMWDQLATQLTQIQQQLSDSNSTATKVAVLETEVESLKESKKSQAKFLWTLAGGLGLLALERFLFRK